jgi:hypothetical protein
VTRKVLPLSCGNFSGIVALRVSVTKSPGDFVLLTSPRAWCLDTEVSASGKQECIYNGYVMRFLRGTT